MTQISLIHDGLYAKMASLLPTYKELRNPYRIDNNDQLFLRKGFGLYIGAGENTSRFLACEMSIRRQFVFTITVQMPATERDVALRKTVEKNLLEDQFLVIKNIEKDATLNQLLAKIDYLSDSGIQEVVVDQNAFLMIQSNMQFEYFEQLN